MWTGLGSRTLPAPGPELAGRGCVGLGGGCEYLDLVRDVRAAELTSQ